VLADEVVRIDLGLIAIVDLLAGVLGQLGRELRRLKVSSCLDLVRAMKVDLLRDECIRTIAVTKLPSKISPGRSQYDNQHRLKVMIRQRLPCSCGPLLEFSSAPRSCLRFKGNLTGRESAWRQTRSATSARKA
jgi:hypothetical protein